MLDEFEEKLNTLLTETYNNINKVEENTLRKSGINASISEVHLVDAVGRMERPTVSAVAPSLGITMASVTVAVNKLVERGMIAKEKNPEDRRSAFLKLTKEGMRTYRIHKYFHRKMVRAVLHGLDETAREAVCLGVDRLNEFFKESIDMGREEP
jgi:DNA-binding MarR family transcriptional regulator